MALNKIVKYNLKSKAIALKNEGKSNESIADILSKDSNLSISESSVQRFFESNDKDVAEAISKNDKLKTRIAEAEIAVMEKRLSHIEKLEYLFETCESKAEVCMVSRELREHFDSVNKSIGKWINAGINIDNSKTENKLNVILHLPRKDPLPGKI